MWGSKTLSAITIVGITLFGSSALLVEGQENSEAYVQKDESFTRIEDAVTKDKGQQQLEVGFDSNLEEENAEALAEVEADSSLQLEEEVKTLEDFPSPIRGEPLRVAGEYYSDELETTLFHPGSDYAQAEGAVIRVKHEGRVVYAGADPFLGHKVEVDCGDDWSVVYGGLKNLRVKEGDWVEVDQAIGQIGYYPDIFGNIEQTHLHYEVWQGDFVQIP